jgi:hypothetical protein
MQFLIIFRLILHWKRVAVPVPPNSLYDGGVDMPQSVHITAPWPTQEEMEKHYPISRTRKKALQVLVDEFKAQLSHLEVAPVTSIEPEKRRKRASAA